MSLAPPELRSDGLPSADTEVRPGRTFVAPGGPTAGLVVAVLAGLWALAVGLQPLHDNSFFTHLATGRLLLERGLPHVDGYSFTAHGHPWVVQSWLASLVYGVVDALGGGFGLLLLNAVVTVTLALLIVALARPTTGLLGRVAVVGLALAVGTGGWAERPFLMGLVLLAVVLLAAEGRVGARWLLPAMWVWTNVHGSFPLGLLALGALAAGRRLDGERPDVELRALRWALAGVALSVVNPLGPRLVLFPLHMLGQADSLRNVLEWQAPSFTDGWQRAFLLQVVLAVATLVRRRSWRNALPVLVFVPLALLTMRNIVIASVVLVPVTAHGLAGVGALGADLRRRVFRPAGVALVALGLLLVVKAAQEPAFGLDAYPVEALAWMHDHGATVGDRWVTQDFVGNYRELAEGDDARVFIDDRYDLFPVSLVDDYLTLKQGRPGWDRVLRRWDASAVLWERDLPLAQLVQASPAWRVVHRDAKWLIAVPR